MTGSARKPSSPRQRLMGAVIGLTIVVVMLVAGTVLCFRGVTELVDTYRFNTATACGTTRPAGCRASLPATVTPLGFDASNAPFAGVAQKVHVRAQNISQDVDLKQGTSIDQVNTSRATAEIWDGRVIAIIVNGKRIRTTRNPRYSRGALFAIIGALLTVPGLLVLVAMTTRMIRRRPLTRTQRASPEAS